MPKKVQFSPETISKSKSKNTTLIKPINNLLSTLISMQTKRYD